MTLFSPRVPHLFPRKALARLLAPTYAAARSVDEEEAYERLLQALEVPAVLADLHRGLSSALAQRAGPRTPADRLLDRVSEGLTTRGGNVRPAPDSPGLAAALVRIDLELGLAAEPMRAVLQSPRGAAALEGGLTALGAHLVKELLK